MPYEYSDWTSVVSETTGTAYTRSASDVGTLSDATGRERGRTYQRYALTDNVTVENVVVRLVLADEELSDSILRELVAARTLTDAPFLEDYTEWERGRELADVEALADLISTLLLEASDWSDPATTRTFWLGVASIGATGSISVLIPTYGIASLAGSGSVSASSLLEISGVAVIEGTGALAGISLLVIPSSVSMAGTGALSASALVEVLGIAGLSGAGSVVALWVINGVASLSGSGSVVVVGILPTADTAAIKRMFAIGGTQERVSVVGSAKKRVTATGSEESV